jgi:hypothetical protein
VTIDRYGHLFPDESERVAEALERIYQSSARKNRNEALPLRLVEPPDDD